jgi:hypothetical protein
MLHRNWSRVAAALLATALATAAPGVATGAPTKARPGIIELTITAPVEGTALVEVERVDASAPRRAVVHELGDDYIARVEVPSGTYRITPKVLVVDEVRYVAQARPLQVRVKPGATAKSSVGYVRSKGVQRLRVTGLAPRSVSLDWEAERGDGTIVRRVEGDDPAERPGEGTSVAVDGSSLTDGDVEPGTTYTYSIFARPGDGAFGHADGDPATITVGTPSEAGSTEPTFVLNPAAEILSPDDIVAATPAGDGVRLDLGPEVDTPSPGTILAVPVFERLEGGYIGEVVDISDDGRNVSLVPAAMGAAFDLFHLETPDIPDADAAVSATAAPELHQLDEESRARATRGTSQREATAGAPEAFVAAASRVECAIESDIVVTPNVSLSHAGHADITIDKHRVLFVDVPSGVSFDVGYTASLQGTVDIEAANAIECGVPLPNYFAPVTTYPVPLSLEVRPEVGVSVSSAGSVSNLGFTATAGFETDGHLGFDGGNSVDGRVINTSSPTQPTGTGTFGFGIEVGGSMAFGPGVGSRDAGVIAGVGGDLYIVDASASVVQVDDGASTSTCIELSAESRLEMFLTLRAWLPGYALDQTLAIEPLQGSFRWGGSPWHWPEDCTEGETPTDDVVGDGVSVIDDDLVGSSDQWGKVEGFVPGESTWVLSTGRIQDAVGEPSFFASTALGGGGDADLSALSGFPTHDSTAFSVTLVPNGQTLKVRYAFASEEYPEYVGSSYNDVMAVFVDGENCALVPGTQSPVSVNTVNADENANYFIDNQLGAAGYGTTMDGLTVPLTCSVPVTPGEPVTVKIAVADASDQIYDSAVALLDGGIWPE